VAGASLLALIDDITTVLDDVALLTKVAAKKTAGVVGDDLAVNAEQVTGVQAARELPVVWAVARGSLLNKAILVPAALAISAVAPWAVTPLLMLGGLFLCYEAAEKLLHGLGSRGRAATAARREAVEQAIADPALDLVAFERDKIRGAIRTDFILSAEIIAITLGTVAAEPFATRALVLSVVALAMTVGVYGLVAGIVKLDDLGLALTRWQGRGAAAAARALGRGILRSAPWLMKFLSFAGTAAMFLVGGGILVHGVHELLADGAAAAAPDVQSALQGALGVLGNLAAGIAAGLAAVAVVALFLRLLGRRASGAA
jgi:hypothetical protein